MLSIPMTHTQTKMQQMRDELATVTKVNNEWVKVCDVLYQRMMSFKTNLDDKLDILNDRTKLLQGKKASLAIYIWHQQQQRQESLSSELTL